jgi:hypothetical protein
MTVRTTSGILLIVSLVLHLCGVVLFCPQPNVWQIDARTYPIWEKGPFMATYSRAGRRLAGDGPPRGRSWAAGATGRHRFCDAPLSSRSSPRRHP